MMKRTSLTLFVIMSFTILFISCTQSYPDGSLSLACGATTGPNKDWISDTPFTRSRKVGIINDPSTTNWQRNIFAYFTNLAANKYCYLLPVKPGMLYLVRTHFYAGALQSGIPLASIFDLFINGIKWTKVNLKNMQSNGFLSHEIILAAKSDFISLCLARNSETEKTNYLFISTIALRPLNSAFYNSTNFHNNALVLLRRNGFGIDNDNLIYYPDDDFDRVWHPYSSPTSVIISTSNDAFGKGLPNQPPVAVLQTAITTQQVGDLLVSYPLPSSVYQAGSYYFALYFCNINETSLPVNNRFQVIINDHHITNQLQFTSFLQCLVVQKNLEFGAIEQVNITLHPGEGSETGPFINAAEVFQIRDIQNMTHLGDLMAIRKIANSTNVPDDWFGGDPCLPAGYACRGIVCNEDNPSRVIILNLTSFGLSGNIPPIIGNLTALTHLLLGSNNLSGSIPDFGSLKNLTTLELQNNQLTGGIPKSLAKLPRLNRLYMENNKLNLTVPPGLNRPGLDLRVTPQSNFLAVNKSNKTKIWIVGCLVGASLVVVVLVTFLWKCIHRLRACITNRPIMPPQEKDGDEGHAKEYYRLAVQYTEEEIKASTNNYSTLIGKGGYGSVYSGTISGYDVAVKILSSTSNQGQQEFENEVNLLCRLYHKNLVNLIGYSKLPVGALVYEYMNSGTLKDHLYGTPELKKSLDWNTRLSIALQAAEGLLYLHQGCNPPIIHRDIKCTNILLDGRMTAKVADFGLAKLLENSQTHASTSVKGTLGYLDPEYYRMSSLTEKSDVYSFGVVLLEMISGTPPSENIVALARELISCGRIAELMDSSLGGHYKLSSVWKVAEVAYACVAPKTIDRPTMRMVVKDLEEAVIVEFQDSTGYEHISTRVFHDSDMPTAR